MHNEAWELYRQNFIRQGGKTMSQHTKEWIMQGFPWCDTCGEAAVFSELHGYLHSTKDYKYGLSPHMDDSGHDVTISEWEQALSERT